MTKKVRVGLICGGKSAEHEISLLSARNVFEALDRDKYEVVLLGIDRAGVWHLNDAEKFLDYSGDSDCINQISLASNGNLVPTESSSCELVCADASSGNLDVVIPMMHGPHGEDGTIQGFLELLGTPYVGSGVLGSALGMDKASAKAVLRDAGIKVAGGVVLKAEAWGEEDLKGIADSCGFPCFVKPSNMGSSVGVSKVDSADDLKAAIEHAFEFDRKVLVEEQIVGREIECAVLGNDKPEASIAGEIVPAEEHGFYSGN